MLRRHPILHLSECLRLKSKVLRGGKPGQRPWKWFAAAQCVPSVGVFDWTRVPSQQQQQGDETARPEITTATTTLTTGVALFKLLLLLLLLLLWLLLQTACDIPNISFEILA